MPGPQRNRAMSKKVMQRAIHKAINSQLETKHKSFTAASWVDIGSVSGTLTELTNIGQGVGDNQRVGNKLTLQKLYIQKNLRVEDNASIPHSTIRVLLVQSRGGALSTSDMPNFASPVDLDKMVVFRDFLVNLSSTGQNSTGTYFGSSVKRIVIKLRKFAKKSLQYNDSTTTPQNNPVYLYMLSDNAQGQQVGFETIYYKDA